MQDTGDSPGWSTPTFVVIVGSPSEAIGQIGSCAGFSWGTALVAVAVDGSNASTVEL